MRAYDGTPNESSLFSVPIVSVDRLFPDCPAGDNGTLVKFPSKAPQVLHNSV